MNLQTIVVGLIVNAVWCVLLFFFREAVRPPSPPEQKRSCDLAVIVRQLRICLPVLVCSSYFLGAVKAESPFSLRGILWCLAVISGTLSYLLIIGAFDAALEYKRPEDELVQRDRNESRDNSVDAD